MEIGDRTMSLAGYRYGFNGKEKDPSGEWGSQAIYDYGFRIYNPGLGKFLSVDPLADSYPWNSTYAFAENDVIRSIDLDGAEKLIHNTFEDTTPISSAVRLTHAYQTAHRAYHNSGLSNNRKDLTALGDKLYYVRAVNQIWQHVNTAYYGLTDDQKNQLMTEAVEMLYVVSVLGFTCESCLNEYHAEISNIPGYEDAAYVRQAALISDLSEAASIRVEAIGMLTANLDAGGNSSKSNVANKKFNVPLTQPSTKRSLITLKDATPQPDREGVLSFGVSDGKITLSGRAVTSGRFDFVITKTGQLRIGDGHFALSGGANKVKAAGQIKIYNGQITRINNSSGHYKPTVKQGEGFPSLLKGNGVNVSGAKLKLYGGDGKLIKTNRVQ